MGRNPVILAIPNYLGVAKNAPGLSQETTCDSSDPWIIYSLPPIRLKVCVATITPLAQVIHRDIDSSIAAKDYSELVQKILQRGDYEGKRILVCWHHEEVHDLAHGLGGVGIPKHWPKSVFDRIWRLEYNGSDHPTFENSPQNVLPGDTAS